MDVLETQKGAQVFLFLRHLHKRYRDVQDDESDCPEISRDLLKGKVMKNLT